MIHWFKRHPQHLAKESNLLSTDVNYKQLCQVRDNLFVSYGHIKVFVNKPVKYPVLIVYPEATPYELPAIYPLDQELTEDQVKELAKGSMANLQQSIKPFVKFYYHLRHQNQTGNLCILEWDNLDDGSKFYGITTILKRVKAWCTGLHTSYFPPDSQEVEFCAHFNKVDWNYMLFYPQNFLNENLIDGEVFATQFQHRYERKTYFGSFLTGRNKSGLYEEVDFNLPAFFIEEGINNPIELINKKETLKRLDNDGKIIKMPWFQVSKEPSPFKEVKELVAIIGEGNFEKGVDRLMLYLAEDLKYKPDKFFVAIRFPNLKNIQEFQLFKVDTPLVSGALINISGREAFSLLLNSYQSVAAIPCENFSEETYHQRNTGRADRKLLKEHVVNVVGVGALGSEIADIMAKAGVGTICLFDNQIIKGPNPVRHLAGLDYIGVEKVLAVQDIISNHNPFIQVKINPYNLNTIDLIDSFKDDSIAISSIADDNVEGYLNERAVIGDKIVYYIRALRGGKAARIFRVIPGKDACFNCLDLYHRQGEEFIDIPEDKNLPTLKNECNNPVRPASAADLKLVSSLGCRILLDELQNNFSQSNHWIWSTEELPDLKAFELKSQFINPHPHCYYCNHEKKLIVYLPKDILLFMQQLIKENPAIETGGVLAGKLNEHGDYVITHASGPGPGSIRTATKFEKDIEFCQKYLDELYVNSKNEIIYLGEWHSHPCKNNKPSGTDLKSLSQIAYQKEYLTDMPVMIIFSNTGNPSCTIHPAGKRHYFTDLILD